MRHDIITVAVVSAVTIAVRFLPFIVFRDSSNVPESVTYLGKALRGAVMGMLVIYCLKDISLFIPPYGIPEIAAVLFTSAAYLWKRDTSLSVVIGTLLYMLMVQKVF